MGGHITVRWGEARSDRVVRSLGDNSRSAHRGRLRSGVSKRRVRNQSCVRVWIRFLSVRLSAAVRPRERGDLGFAISHCVARRWPVRVCVRLREPTPLSIRIEPYVNVCRESNGLYVGGGRHTVTHL